METGPENWLTALQHLIGGVKPAGFFEILSQECFGTHLKAAVKKVYETTVWFLKVFSRHTYKVGFFVWLVVVCLFLFTCLFFLNIVVGGAIFSISNISDPEDFFRSLS